MKDIIAFGFLANVIGGNSLVPEDDVDDLSKGAPYIPEEVTVQRRKGTCRSGSMTKKEEVIAYLVAKTLKENPVYIAGMKFWKKESTGKIYYIDAERLNPFDYHDITYTYIPTDEFSQHLIDCIYKCMMARKE